MEHIQDVLADTVHRVSGVSITDFDQYLLSDSLGIPIEDFLYMICEWEDKRGYPVLEIMKENDYTIFTINNLAMAITSEPAAPKQ